MRYHLAILKPRYLDLILQQLKTLECRLTRIPCPPFQLIARGDKIYLKASAGPVLGTAWVEKVRFFQNLTAAGIEKICQSYNDRIIASPDYWLSRGDCRYCTLVWLKDVQRIKPYPIKTQGFRAWLTSDNDAFASPDQHLPNGKK